MHQKGQKSRERYRDWWVNKRKLWWMHRNRVVKGMVSCDFNSVLTDIKLLFLRAPSQFQSSAALWPFSNLLAPKQSLWGLFNSAHRFW